MAELAGTTTTLPIEVARQKGLFEQEGVSIKAFQAQGVINQVQVLIAGDVDVAYLGFDGILGAAAAGGKVKYIAELLDEVPFSMVVSPNIKSYKDLKGRRVGGAGAASYADNLIRAALSKRGGLDPNKDVEYVFIAGIPARLTALVSGQVAGTSLNFPSQYNANKQGFPTLDYISDALGKWSGMGLVTTEAKLAQKAEALRRFVRGSLAGAKLVHQDRAGTIASLQKMLKLEPEAAALTYDAWVKRVRLDGRWDDAGLANSVEYYRTDAKRDPGTVASLIDRRFLP